MDAVLNSINKKLLNTPDSIIENDKSCDKLIEILLSEAVNTEIVIFDTIMGGGVQGVKKYNFLNLQLHQPLIHKSAL